MDDTVNLGILYEDLLQCSFICDVYMVELWALSTTQELNTIEGNFRRVVKTVDDDDLVAMPQECKRSEGPNVAGTSEQANISISFVLVGLRPLPVDGRGTISLSRSLLTR